MRSLSKSGTPRAEVLRSPERKHVFNVAERERLLARLERSGLTHRRFCLENDLPLSTLGYWLRQRRGQVPHTAQVRGAFVRVPPVAISACVGRTEGPDAGTVQIQLPNQVELKVGAGADPIWVGALLKEVHGCSG